MALSLKSPRSQMITIILCLMVAGAYLWHTFRSTPMQHETEVLVRRNGSLAEANKMARQALGQGMDKIKQASAAYDRQDASIAHLMPADTTSTSLLPLITATAQENDVTITQLVPAARIPGPDFDMESYSATVRGRYHNVAAFIAAVGNMDRIVHVSAFNGKSTPETDDGSADGEHAVLMEAAFQVDTYLEPAGTDTVAAGNGKGHETDEPKVETPTIRYEKRQDGKLFELVYVPSKDKEIRLPVPESQRSVAEAWISRNGKGAGK